MQFNNSNFGKPKDALTKSLYNESFEESRPSPPPGEYYLIDDSMDFLLDDSEDFLIDD